MLNREFGLTVVTIEHHAEFIARYAQSVVLMSGGAPVWHLPVQEAVNRSAELAEHGIPAPQIVQAAQALGLADAPRTVPDAARALAHLPVDPTPEPETGTEGASISEPVASARNVTFSYNTVLGRRQVVLDGLNVDIRRGDRVALVGGNGSGKTTLLKLLAGITVPRKGEVIVDGINTRQRSASELADHVAYLWQHPQQMFVKESIERDIALFPEERGVEGWEGLVTDTLDQVRLSGFADRDGRTLSGGQQRRATLGIGLAMRPTLLLADEPTASLDVTSREAVTVMLSELATDGTMSSVVATHDMSLVAEWATRVLVLEGGTVIGDLTPGALFARPDLLERANLVPPQITQLGHALGITPPPLNVADFVSRIRKESHHGA